MERISMEERVVIGAAYNGHVGEGHRGDENVMGRFGDKKRNAEGGGRSTQVENIICRSIYLKEIRDCKVIRGNVAKQHRLLLYWMTLETKNMKIAKAEPIIKWWKSKKEDCCEEFREEIRRTLGGKEELPDDWTTTAKLARDTERTVLGV